jgi:hypothetical protein
MLKKALFVVAAIAVLGVVVHAGEVKQHDWPKTWSYTKVEIPGLSIPVKMDIGYWIHIKDQGDIAIKLSQDDIHSYSGCDSMVIECNFNLTLSAAITATGQVGGDYGVSVNPADIDSPGGTAQVCATLANANLGSQPGGTNNVHVANIKIFVIPR